MKKGQALLVVLLVLGVVMTVGLAVVSRSVTEVSISTTAEESTRALEAAEAGVEKSLAGVSSVSGPSGGTVSLPESSASVTVTNGKVGDNGHYILPYDLDPGDVANVDLSGLSPNQLRVCWGDTVENPVAEVMIYSGSGSNINMRKWVLGPGFVDPEHTSNCPTVGKNYSYWQSWRSSDWGGEPLIMMRIRMIGANNPQRIAVSVNGSDKIPVQGKDTFSTGTAGSTSKKVRVVRMNPDAPFMFDSALFSGTTLIK